MYDGLDGLRLITDISFQENDCDDVIFIETKFGKTVVEPVKKLLVCKVLFTFGLDIIRMRNVTLKIQMDARLHFL